MDIIIVEFRGSRGGAPIYTPVAMPRNMRYGSNFWSIYSLKLRRRAHFFSDLEYDHWIHVETNPFVKTFCEQPLRIRHSHGGKVVESVFDMWIQYIDKTETFVEVKYEAELDPNNPKSTRALRQTRAQESWCHENGKPYKIVTEEKIRSNSLYLSNLKQIVSYTKNRAVPVETDRHRLLQFIGPKKVTIGEIERAFETVSPQRVRETICMLIYSGKLAANLTSCVIGPYLEVWISDQT